MWWDAERIERAVTRDFACAQLLPVEIERLDKPPAFGGGLTDGTYWEWISGRARRLFLILVDLDVPDQIFGVIDDGWEDDDLPIALDQVERLALTPAKDDKLERRFYHRQFHYLLRPLERGEHVLYQSAEVVPLDVVDRRQSLTGGHAVDKVELPNAPGQAFSRRRIPLGTGPGCLSYEDFLDEVEGIKAIQNEHLESYWGSYTHQDTSYVLFAPACDYTLKSFLATVPSSVKNMEKRKRRELVMNWIHCLVDTVCFIHNRGLAHGSIRPSTVMFTSGDHVFLHDFTRLNPEVLAGRGAGSFDKEMYDYAAPEQWTRPTASNLAYRRVTLTTMSASPDTTTFSISRSGAADQAPPSPQTLTHTLGPQLNPQAADVFALGCVILELLSYLLKRTARGFAAHRAAKNKTAGRGGAVLDSSFHRNLGQVEAWMAGLARDAAKKRRGDDEDRRVFRGVAPMLHVVERMLALHPGERPSAFDVQTRMYQILTESCGITEPHCVHQYGGEGWDYGLGSLRLSRASTTPAATDAATETMSVGTRRSSGYGSGSTGSVIASSRAPSLQQHYYGGGGSSNAGGSAASVADRESVTQHAASTQSRGDLVSGGLHAVEKLRIRDKLKPWQADGYGANSRPASLGVP